MTPSEIAVRLVTMAEEEDGWLYVRCVGMESMSVRPEYEGCVQVQLAEKRATELRARIEEALR